MNKQFKKFLESTKLTAETITALLPFLKLLGTGIAVFVVVMSINTCHADKKEQEYLARMTRFIDQADSAKKYADSLAKRVEMHETAARDAAARAGTARRQAEASKVQVGKLQRGLDSLKEAITDSIEMARVIIPKQDSIITEQTVVINRQELVITNFRTVIINKDSSINLLTFSRDSLRTVVNNIPAPPKPPLFPKITRKQAFVAGVLGGIAVTVFGFTR